jgi:carboxymethylenebutenolidase
MKSTFALTAALALCLASGLAFIAAGSAAADSAGVTDTASTVGSDTTAATATGADSAALSDLDRMAAEHEQDTPTPSPATTPAPAQPVTASEVTFGMIYGHPVRGYLAQPTPPRAAAGAAPAPAAPGIIVIHEWWGLNDNIKAMTRRLAGEGYSALAVDLYNGKVADKPDDAKKLAGQAMGDHDGGIAILRAADDFLKKQGAPKVGVIGWCFGGGWALTTALEIPQGIDAAVMYYGQPEKEHDRLAKLQAPLLGLFGADDKSIPPAAVHAMEATLKQLGKSVDIHIYDGAGHAFANPSGTGYRPAAADDAWQRTVAFFNQKLK